MTSFGPLCQLARTTPPLKTDYLQLAHLVVLHLPAGLLPKTQPRDPRLHLPLSNMASRKAVGPTRRSQLPKKAAGL